MTAPQQFPFSPEAFAEARLNATMTIDMLQSVPESRRPGPEEIAELFSHRGHLSPEAHVVALCATVGVLFRLLSDRPE